MPAPGLAKRVSRCSWTSLSRRFAVCVLLLHLPHVVKSAWVNLLDEKVDFKCPAGEFISDVASIFASLQTDRRWGFSCSKVPTCRRDSKCEWSDYVNDFKEPYMYACPGEGFIAGISSFHSNPHEDRRVKFLCCTVPGVLLHGCHHSANGFENKLREALNFTVTPGKVLTGVTSFFQEKDRRFTFLTCSMFKCDCHAETPPEIPIPLP